MLSPTIGYVYKHYKGNHYNILILCKHSETGEELVVYERLEDSKKYARPLNIFFEDVEFEGKKVKRFILDK